MCLNISGAEKLLVLRQSHHGGQSDTSRQLFYRYPSSRGVALQSRFLLPKFWKEPLRPSGPCVAAFRTHGHSQRGSIHIIFTTLPWLISREFEQKPDPHTAQRFETQGWFISANWLVGLCSRSGDRKLLGCKIAALMSYCIFELCDLCH